MEADAIAPTSSRAPHLTAFKRFFDSTESRLEALVAFGIFTESEQKAELQGNQKQYVQNLDTLLRSNRDFCLEEAKKALLQQSLAAVEGRSSEILTDVVQRLKTSALADNKKFRCKGVSGRP